VLAYFARSRPIFKVTLAQFVFMSRGRKKVLGVCRICLQYGELSFEHVPPESAFNGTRVLQHTMDDWLKSHGTLSSGGRISQRGIGDYTLCPSCNSKTGGWYGNEYARWAEAGLHVLPRVPSGAELAFNLSYAYPLRFLKQAVAMFFSVNGPEVEKAQPDLVRFVLDKNRRSLQTGFNVFVRLYRGPLARCSGLSAVVKIGSEHRFLSEIAYPPFSIVFSPSSRSDSMIGCISHFGDFGYDERRSVTIATGCGEVTHHIRVTTAREHRSRAT
jgi:hypothetical protein